MVIDFHNFGARNGTDFYDFGIRNRINAFWKIGLTKNIDTSLNKGMHHILSIGHLTILGRADQAIVLLIDIIET